MTINTNQLHCDQLWTKWRFAFTVGCIAILILTPTARANRATDFIAKDPSKASAISLGSTLGPTSVGLLMAGVLAAGDESGGTAVTGLTAFGLITFGLIAGPGMGHSYAGNKKQLWTGVALRGVSVIGMFLSFGLSWNHPDSKTAAVSFGACSVVLLWSTIHDIGTAGRSARDYNEARGLAKIKLKPTYFAKDKAVGLTLSLPL